MGENVKGTPEKQWWALAKKYNNKFSVSHPSFGGLKSTDVIDILYGFIRKINGKEDSQF